LGWAERWGRKEGEEAERKEWITRPKLQLVAEKREGEQAGKNTKTTITFFLHFEAQRLTTGISTAFVFTQALLSTKG
jgi:hypothetical protein